MKTVEIEATNRCNTRCLHCPHETITRPSGMMTWETFQAVADKVLAYGQTEAIDFAGMGEPTLNPDIYRFIAYFEGKINTYVTTNAAALTSRNIERLIEAGLTAIVVSFNGSEPALYETMMGGLSFKRAESYLADLVKRASGRMQVVANVSVTKQTQDRLPEIQQYLNDMGVQDTFFSKCHSRGGHLKSTYVCDTPMPPVDTGRCDIYANTLFVAWTGDVLACCHDLDGAAPVGSLLTQPLEEIIAHKQTVLQKGLRYDMCGDCNDLYRFSQDVLPGADSISDWVYNLYRQPPERTAFLNQVIQKQREKINGLLLQLQDLESLILQYEQGRLLGFLQEIGFQDRYQPSHDQNGHRLNGRSGQEITLLDWMSSIYRQEDDGTSESHLVIEQQEKRIEELTGQLELAQMTLNSYEKNSLIRLVNWVKS